MSYKLSKNSIDRLLTAHPMLVMLFSYAISTSPIDFSIVCGNRTREEQNEAVRKGNSQLKFPLSKHNKMPSLAVDVIPYPGGYSASLEDWEKLENHIKKCAKELGVSIEYGGDWKNFIDRPHWELR